MTDLNPKGLEAARVVYEDAFPGASVTFEGMEAAIRAYITASPTQPVEAEAVAWRAMDSAPRDRTSIIIAVPTRDQDRFIVGEAYFDAESNEGGDWWWAGTSQGDYHGGPISETNYWPPMAWQPLPAPPTLIAPSPVQQEGGKP